MFSSGPNYTKLKTNLRLAINRLKLLEKKKTELAQKARKEIADYIGAGKVERAKIRVEHIIREDYMVEAMELLEMYCDLLLARFGLIQQMKNLDEGLAEAISTIIWAAPRIQTDVQEMKVIADILTAKYGRQYTDACREEAVQSISEKLKHKMSVQSPSKLLVEKYLIEIANNYNVAYEPDPQVMAEGQDALLIDIGNNAGELPNNLDLASGGYHPPQPVGFVGYPQPPILPNPEGSNNPSVNQNDNPPVGFVSPVAPPATDKDQNTAFNPAAFSYNIPLDNSNKHHPSHEDLPPPYGSFPPDLNKQSDQKPKPQPRSKMPMNDFKLPDLPVVPTENDQPPGSSNDDIDFDDLTKRFEELKKRK
ncbi:IST1 homolog [Neodiprion virginianus]|uniref:IST1 homolog n=1 Tax=Neodiprion fabricii TaxID=2872261 RepID=UPI001ED8D864|nr:IST1 homolog [Neodiprion fabricii]XP_046414643.1 IST1 homolog [Neodiprion fabricii]XP_046603856.1 IST1 homolog [Neodiprion virginianus]XP_046603857.1 IST1 homolog [Neodiprion virginianus]